MQICGKADFNLKAFLVPISIGFKLIQRSEHLYNNVALGSCFFIGVNFIPIGSELHCVLACSDT